MDAARFLSASVTPVVLISACGLVTLALYNRLGAVLARIRSFQGQKIELLDGLRRRHPSEIYPLLTLIDAQIASVTRKAKMLQQALFRMLGAIACYICCSMVAGAIDWHEPSALLALGLELIGSTLFLTGLGWALRELLLSMTPLQEESVYLQTVADQRLAAAAARLEVTSRAA